MNLLWIFIFISVFPLIIVLIGTLRTFQVSHGPQHLAFLRGQVPVALPDGFYRGSVGGRHGKWQGKEFSVATARGVNLFKTKGGGMQGNYPFKFYVGKGIQEHSLDVIKIDYDLPENDFWIRPILDEIVQIAPDVYLGKLYYRLNAHTYFALGYFELQADSSNATNQGADAPAPMRLE